MKISVGKDVENLELSYISGGNVKYAATLENNLPVPQKVKPRVTICSRLNNGPPNVPGPNPYKYDLTFKKEPLLGHLGGSVG